MKFLFSALILLSIVSCDILESKDDDTTQATDAANTEAQNKTAAAQMELVTELEKDAECETDQCKKAQDDFKAAAAEQQEVINNGTYRYTVGDDEVSVVEYTGTDSITITEIYADCNPDGTFESDSVTYSYTHTVVNDSLRLYNSKCFYSVHPGESSSIIGTWDDNFYSYNLDTSNPDCELYSSSYEDDYENGGNFSLQSMFGTAMKVENTVTYTSTEQIKSTRMSFNCYTDAFVQFIYGDHPSYQKIDCNSFSVEVYGYKMTGTVAINGSTAKITTDYQYEGLSCSESFEQAVITKNDGDQCSSNSCDESFLKPFCKENMERFVKENEAQQQSTDTGSDWEIGANTDADLFESICDDYMLEDIVTIINLKKAVSSKKTASLTSNPFFF